MLINVDFKKAYDRISWVFIKDMLEKVGLPHVWIRNIMHYIEIVRTLVVWNDKHLEWFRPSRGLYRVIQSVSTFLFSAWSD